MDLETIHSKWSEVMDFSSGSDYPKTPNDAFKFILKNLQRNAKL